MSFKASSALLLVFVATVLRLAVRRRSLKILRGPPSPSFLTGNEHQMRCQSSVGDLEFEWSQEYGAAYRIAGCLGEDVLFLADPKGLQYVMQTSAYRYPKTQASAQGSRLLVGWGLLWADGEVHRRQRKAMNPAFSVAQTRSYHPVVQATAAKLVAKWTEDLEGGPKILDVSRPLASVALDALGEAAFKYRFGSLDGWEGSMAKAFDNLLVDVSVKPNGWDLVLRSFWRYIPPGIMTYMTLIPTQSYRRTRSFLKRSMDTARDVLAAHVSEESGGNRANDVLSVLARSSTSSDPKIHMEDWEVESQMSTLMLAGHETTSSSIVWALYELARYPEVQDALRKEIVFAKASLALKHHTEFTSAELEELPLLNAVIKETLRFHPIVPQLFRRTSCDDVIPLSSPVQARDGTMLTEIQVTKGQVLNINIATYNRLPQVWGEDAGEWNPDRFLQSQDDAANMSSSVGVVGNLMTFSAGVKACIGWRFAVMEMQDVLADLLEHFQFSLPSPKPEIHRTPAGPTMVSMVEGQGESSMPLMVTIVEA